MTRTASSPHGRRPARYATAAAALFALLAALSTWPAILFLPYAGRPADDQARYHEVAVRAFADQWPWPDLSDYASATSPGYHLALSLVCQVHTTVQSTPRASIQLVGSVFTLFLAALLAAVAALELRAAQREQHNLINHRHHGQRHDSPRLNLARATVVCLPFLASKYVWASGVWLLPDNAGWLGVLCVLGLALTRLNGGVTTAQRLITWWALSAVALALLVFTRQSHAWTAGLLIVSAFLAPAGWPASIVRDESPSALLTGLPRRLLAGLFALSACLPAFLLLAYLVNLWGGLVPPTFQKQHASGFNAATPALMLALLALISFCFAGHLLAPLAHLWRTRRSLLIAAAVVGLLLAVLPTTTYVYEQRGSGLWNLVKALEARGVVIAGHTSPIFIVLTPIGCVALCAWVAMVRTARRWLALAAFLGFMLAQTANTNAWQRYLEPGLLMFAAIWSAWGWFDLSDQSPAHARSARPGRFDLARIASVWKWLGPIALALALIAISVIDYRSARIIPTYEQRQAR